MRPYSRWCRAGFAALALAWVVPAHAQESTMLASSPAQECMTRGTEPPEYPLELYERRDDATLNVELIFGGPDDAPRVVVKSDTAYDGRFEAAVRKYVRQFRVPCMKAEDAPVRLRQVYVFTPNDGRKVAVSAPVDERAQERKAKLACITHVLNIKAPSYSRNALLVDAQGPVIVNLRFVQPDAPPEVRILAAAHKLLKQEIEDYSAGLRLPCLEGDTISLNRLYDFKLVGGERTVLRDTKLPQLLASARNLTAPVFFNFDTMGCPFDVRMTYFQPYLSNDVHELETSRPARQPFLDWLSGLTLNLDEKTNLRVVGKQMTIGVPCGSLDL